MQPQIQSKHLTQKPPTQEQPTTPPTTLTANKQKILLYNWQALKLFLPYLKISDLLPSISVSKQWQYNLSQYFKQFVLCEYGLYGNCANSDVWGHLRTVYNRRVVMYEMVASGQQQDNQHQHNNNSNSNKGGSHSENKSIIKKQIYLPFICTNIQVANHISKLQTLQGDTYIIKNTKLKSPTNLTKKDFIHPHPHQNQTNPNTNPSLWKVPTKYTKIYCIGNYLYLIDDCFITRYTTTNQSMFQEELHLDFQETIDYFVCSVSACVVVTGFGFSQGDKSRSNKSKNNMNMDKDQDKDKKIISPNYMLFTHKQPHPKRINFPLNIHINNPENDIILDYGVHGFIISSQGVLYETDFVRNYAAQKQKERQQQNTNLIEQQLLLNQVKGVKGKIIQKLKCGAKHFFAYERKTKPIKSWTNTQVLKWAQKQGFDAYLKIFLAQKVTGQKLLKMNKDYMQNVLGITSTLTQQKITLLIQQCNTISDNFQDYTVYAWGKNDKGQLCTNPSGSINPNNPIKLKLPQGTQLLTCFGQYTIITNPKTKQVMINTIQEQTQGNYTNNKLKFQTLSTSKVWTISGNKNIILLCESIGKKRISQAMSQQPLHNKKQKLRTAKNIIDQIQWDQNLSTCQQQFKVGYSSRFQGTLQCKFDQFLKSDIKQNSILYFKRNGKIVWDKKTRIDIL